MKALIVEKKRKTAPMLEDAGCLFSYSEVHDASQARAMIDEGGFQLIVLDGDMPGLECLSLVKHIRREDASGYAYIIVIGCPDDEVARDAFTKAGADDVISGPVGGYELKKSVKVAGRTLTLNNTLSRAYAQMAELEKAAAIGRLVPGIAHEINNPLGFIAGNLSVLTDYCRGLCEQVRRCRVLTPEKASAAVRCDAEAAAVPTTKRSDASMDIDFVLSDIFALLDECKEGLDRMKTLVRDIQHVSHDNAGHPVDININDCLDATLNVLWSELKYKAAVNKSYGRLPLVNGHSGQVHQVFLNLLLHAAHVIKEKGEINITTTSGDGHVAVSIAGSGYPENQRVVSDKEDSFFTGADPWGNPAPGLLIARTIVRDHDGFLDIEPAANSGTAYRVRLPVKQL